jgi:hypothetical protein
VSPVDPVVLDPATSLALDAICDGEGLTHAVTRHVALTLRSQLAALLKQRDDLRAALECEEAYSHARSSNEWMATLTEAGWDGKSNPRPFINALRRTALGGGGS